MKKLLTLFALCALFAACGNNDEPTPTQGFAIDDSQLTITLPGTEGTKSVRFSAYENWSTSIPLSEMDWCKISPSSGNSGNVIMAINVTANSTGKERTATITLRAGTMTKDITVTQASQDVISVTPNKFNINNSAQEIEFTVTANVEYTCTVRKADQEWIKEISKTSGETSGTTTSTTYRFNVLENTVGTKREGTIIISNTASSLRQDVTVKQVYESTDFSEDGEIITLQKAEVSGDQKGINIIMMGDAFSDRLIADGTYEKVMRDAEGVFFSEEPYTTFRKFFNVYAVKVVSKNEEFFEGAETALGCYFGEGTEVGGQSTTVKNYAKKVVTSSQLTNTLIIVMMNREYYAGTCYMTKPVDKFDYGCGLSIAYFPIGTDAEMFKQLLCHEAGGHGFPKLADEYFFEQNGTITTTALNEAREVEGHGWFKNVDFTNDPAKIKWSAFISDERYANDGINIFEGGNTYAKGVYRPTNTSIMNDNTGGFNAPSREAIYYRIHKLVYGNSWVYDREEFVKYDATNRNKAAQAAPRNAVEHFQPLHPPVIVSDPL